MKDPTAVHVGDGQGEGFWDVGFDDDQIAYAQIEAEDMRGVCVSIEGIEMTLNNGYAPGSQPHQDENALLDTFREAIVAALVVDHRIQRDHPEFVAAAMAEQTTRCETLAELAQQMREWADDEEMEVG